MQRLSLLVLFTALLATSVGCDPAVHARGTVRDEAGKPVAGAEVTLVVAGSERTGYASTDSVGYFEVTRMGSYRLPVELRVCQGEHQLAAQEFTTQEALRDSLRIVLKRRLVPSSVLATGRPLRC